MPGMSLIHWHESETYGTTIFDIGIWQFILRKETLHGNKQTETDRTGRVESCNGMPANDGPYSSVTDSAESQIRQSLAAEG
jgi:hypothetical protein